MEIEAGRLVRQITSPKHGNKHGALYSAAAVSNLSLSQGGCSWTSCSSSHIPQLQNKDEALYLAAALLSRLLLRGQRSQPSRPSHYISKLQDEKKALYGPAVTNFPL